MGLKRFIPKLQIPIWPQVVSDHMSLLFAGLCEISLVLSQQADSQVFTSQCPPVMTCYLVECLSGQAMD